MPEAHLAVALDDAGWHAAAWREPDARPAELCTAGYWLDLVREAQLGLLDFVTIEDSVRQGPTVRARLDAIMRAARVAPLTRHIGIVPAACTTLSEPFLVSTQIATLDFVTRGRAGWLATVATNAGDAGYVGPRPVPEPPDRYDEAADHVEVVRRLWDSWEDGAEIRDVASGRFLDRRRVHRIGFEGRHFSVLGPSITPRPPQGQPIVVATADTNESFAFAARSADIALMSAHADDDLVAALRRMESALEASRRDPAALRAWLDIVVFLDEDPGAALERRARLEAAGPSRPSPGFVFAGSPEQLATRLIEWHALGWSGVRMHPATLPGDLHAITRRLVPHLQALGAFRTSYHAETLRAQLRTDPPDQPLCARMTAKQVHLGIHFPGVNNTTVWSDPRSGSHIEFDSFAHLAQTAERGKFDFFFLAEGLRMREHAGELHDLDVAGRPDSFAALASLAAVTERIGLVATITTTYHEPHEVARQLASLDHLSGGRAGWNLVTSSDAFTGANFRRGGYLPYARRYERGGEFLAATNALWDSWAPDAILADKAGGAFVRGEGLGAFAFHGEQVDIAGEFTVPRSPQGRPVLLQAGDSEEGREFAARHADGIFTRHGTLEAGREFYSDVKRRLAGYGRARDGLLMLPGATFVLGDTDVEAHELADHVRREQVSGPAAIRFLEQVWNRDLSDHDPDGPLPESDPDVAAEVRAQGTANARSLNRDAVAIAREWREHASAGGLSIRELVIEKTSRQTLIGSPATIAEVIDAHVQADACDGFIIVPHVTPGGLDRFVDEVVPLLQERNVFRADYDGPTLRDHLGLDRPSFP